MTNVTGRLSDREVKILKARTGEADTEAPLKASVGRANPKHTSAKLRAALKDSLKEEAAGNGRRFRTGSEAICWLES